jgi:hypothetical protein
MQKSYIKKIEAATKDINFWTQKTLSNTNGDFKKLYPENEWHEYNENFFRSDKFTKDHNGKHILFMGCSETQGQGDSLENAWAYILYKKINQDEKLSGYFNIAVPGQGIASQILILLEYIDNFGKPDEVFLLMPETSRVICSFENHLGMLTMILDEKKYSDSDFMNAHIYAIILLRFLESFCINLNIKFLWSTWWEYEENIFIDYKFDNYFSLNMKNIDHIILKKYEQYSDPTRSVTENLTKADGHKGLVIHKYWADMFYERRQNEKNN